MVTLCSSSCSLSADVCSPTLSTSPSNIPAVEPNFCSFPFRVRVTFRSISAQEPSVRACDCSLAHLHRVLASAASNRPTDRLTDPSANLQDRCPIVGQSMETMDLRQVDPSHDDSPPRSCYRMSSCSSPERQYDAATNSNNRNAKSTTTKTTTTSLCLAFALLNLAPIALGGKF